MAFNITLTESDQQQLQTVIHQGKVNGRVRIRAQILLKIAEGWTVQAIGTAFDTSPATVYNTHTRYQQGGLEGVLQDRVQARRRQALTGEEAALLIAITCSPVPVQHDHWTLRMLRDKLIDLGVVDHISPSTIQAMLKKTNSSRGNTRRGVLGR